MEETEKDRLAAASLKSDQATILLPSGLNNRSLALTDRRLAYTTGEPKGQNNRARRN